MFTGQQDEVTENDQESAKAIVVADNCLNRNNYQYLLGEKAWIKLNKFPQSVGSILEIFEINNIFYLVGTKGISTLNNEIYTFPSNKKYDFCATCRVGNNILVVSKEKYGLLNTINNQWSDANIKIKRKSFAIVYYLNKVWMIGGRQRDDDGKWKTINTVEVYHPVTKNQSLSPIKMIHARYNHKVVVYKKKLFVFGGFGNDGLLNSVEMFSPDTNKFVMMAPMKIARYGFACCRVGNLVYLMGGYRSRNSVEIYNIDSDIWTDGVDFPVADMCLYACVVKNKL